MTSTAAAAAILVLFDSSALSTVVISLRFEVARVTGRAEGVVLAIAKRSNDCCIVLMTGDTRGFTGFVVTRIVIVRARVEVSVGTGTVVECALIPPAGCCMAGIAIHTACVKMSL